MKSSTDSGMNRTGMRVSPELGQELIDAALRAKPSAPGNDQGLAAIRIEYGRQAEPLGSVPVLQQEAAEEAEADEPGMAILTDKLGERLAFERSGVRLYQALLSKLESEGPLPGGPTVQELLHIQEEELAHFELVQSAIEGLGGDPTAVTPSADVTSVASSGLPQVLTDPRTTLRQCLDVILVAELTDNDGWQLLIKLCEEAGEDVLASKFQDALAAEAEHLENVRRWIEQSTVTTAAE
jgi:hypothetical protein